jgi:hypothetical protein
MVSYMKNKQRSGSDLCVRGSCIGERLRNTWIVPAIWIVPAVCMICVLLVLPLSLPAQQISSNDSANNVTVPSGTRMMVRMVDPVDSKKNNENDRFKGTLEANLSVDNKVVAPKGTTVFGRLITAQAASSGQAAQLELDLTDIMIDGEMYSLSTSSKQLEGEGSGGGETGRGAGKGAAVGTVTGGLSGAVRGAGIGAIAGNIVGGTTHGEQVNVAAGALVEFTLEHPVSLPAAK